MGFDFVVIRLLAVFATELLHATEILHATDLTDPSENNIALSVARSGDTDSYAKARIAADIDIDINLIRAATEKIVIQRLN